MRVLEGLAASAAGAWVYLAVGHGGFWRATPQLAVDPPSPAVWPPVAVIVPARDEATLLPETLPTVLAQDYPGDLAVWLVDDGSGDGTAEIAYDLAAGGDRVPLTVLRAPAPAAGWTGKVHALRCGVEAASTTSGRAPAEIFVFTDADIAHEASSVRRLVATAVAERRDLVSLMAQLRVRSRGERALVPAFVYFFAQLYPFTRVGRPGARTAAAAGGCVLVTRAALERAGGLAAVRGARIDDVALGRLLKRSGARIWLGFSGERPEVRSVRGYPDLTALWSMIARSAYVQLRCSPALLAATVAGLGLVYVVPPLAVVLGVLRRRPGAAATGLGAWVTMAATQGPVLRLYGLSRLRGLALPAVAMVYAAMTIDSARRHHTGRGGAWKGRYASG